MQLPDVNVLIALFDPAHVHHESAHLWFTTARGAGWAACPITENGFIRVVSNPAYPTVAPSVSEFCRDEHHRFLPKLERALAGTGCEHVVHMPAFKRR